MGHSWGLWANPLKTKAAKSDFETPIPRPVDLMNGRLLGRIGRELRHAILDTELAAPLQGFRVRLLFEDEAPAIFARAVQRWAMPPDPPRHEVDVQPQRGNCNT